MNMNYTVSDEEVICTFDLVILYNDQDLIDSSDEQF